MLKAYNLYKDKNFTILSVSWDNDRDAWVTAIRKDGLTWSQVSDLKGFDNAAFKKYNIQFIPSNFLIDPSGKIIAKRLRGDGLESKLAEVLNK